MKIGILEWNLSALGGRQKTMMCFADFLKSTGHKIKIYGNFPDERPEDNYNRHSFLQWHSFAHLQLSDFDFDFGIQRKFKQSNIPSEWHSLDILLVPYGGYGYLQEYLPEVRVICWVIHEAQKYYSCIREIWTNSHTTKKRLLLSKNWQGCEEIIKVIRPPHDYSLFRNASKSWIKREYDAVCISSLLESKGLNIFDNVARSLDINAVIIGASWHQDRTENEKVLASLKSDVLVNLKVNEIATILGNSKCYVSTSYAESCSLTIYEALNAGCIPVVRAVGAEAEQCGVLGETFLSDNQLKKRLVETLSESSILNPQKIGIMFDRIFVGPVVEKRITSPDRKKE